VSRLAALPPRALLGLAAAGVLLYAAILFFLFVSPKRSEASRLDDDVAAAELRLADAQAAQHHPAGGRGAPVSDVLRLAKAMPSSGDQAGLVLELSRLAASSGVALRSITSEPAVAGTGGTTTIPVVTVVTGSFRRITTFLRRCRSLVTVRHGRLHATGRLFAVSNVELSESVDAGFPKLDASITLDAYVYDGPIVIETPLSPESTDESSSGTSAAGSGS
jgi:Tfp pilus assembly protein PilO